MTKAFSPAEVKLKQITGIPSFVIDAFNQLLVKKFNGFDATLSQKDVVALIIAQNPEINSKQLFDNKWMDVEPIFEKEGWTVEYDKPAYNESYPATYSFRINEKHHSQRKNDD